MTTPLSSLGKNRRLPLQLPNQGKKAVPDESPQKTVPNGSLHSDEERSLMDEILGPGAQITVRTAIPSSSTGPMAKNTSHGAGPTDAELLASMMKKIVSLEQKIKIQARSIQEKEKTIKVLEEQLRFLKEGKEESSGMTRAEELEVTCLRLQGQIWEMERFLNDYGLIWVGEGTDSETDMESPKEKRSGLSTGVWTPSSSRVPETSINFDLIFQNLKDLNALAGEGTSKIEHITGGARLKQLDAIPLTFYQNGIVMFNGPFRSYEEPSTQQCLRDIMDGFFPSELQRRYPDGIAFQVTDKRDVFFEERHLPESFPGPGQVVSQLKSRGIQDKVFVGSPTKTSEIPGPKFTKEQFLNKLPKLVIRDGNVINIRGDIRKILEGSDGKQAHEVILVEPPSLTAVEKRTKKEKQGSVHDQSKTTLRIRSEDGEKTYLVRMPITETIGTLRQHLDRVRGETEPYNIFSLFPHQVYDNNSLTLQEYGLVPNTALMLRRKPHVSKNPEGEVL